jgi:hypothetical protein
VVDLDGRAGHERRGGEADGRLARDRAEARRDEPADARTRDRGAAGRRGGAGRRR